MIQEFSGEYRWLSNFWPSPVELEGVVYPSVEHAYQAAKTSPGQRAPFQYGSPGEAKRLGRKVPIRQEWKNVKVEVMRALVAQKFSPGTQLGKKLAQTGDRLIIEGNTWLPSFDKQYGYGWAVNWLGVRVRVSLSKQKGKGAKQWKHLVLLKAV